MSEKLLLTTLTRLRSLRATLDAEIANLEREIEAQSTDSPPQDMREAVDEPLTKDTEDWSDRSNAPEIPAR
jgi:hypothetical protein